MSDSTIKRRKRYVDHTMYISKLPCLIHGPRNSTDECKVLGYFGSKYSKSRPMKLCGQEPAKIEKFNRNQEINDMVHHAADEIILQANNKFGV